MFLKGKYIRGLVNKMRYAIASTENKYGYDGRKYQEVPILEAKKELDRTFTDRNGNKKTKRQILRENEPEPFIKFNNRNHGNKSTGSDIRNQKLRDRKLTGRW